MNYYKEKETDNLEVLEEVLVTRGNETVPFWDFNISRKLWLPPTLYGEESNQKALFSVDIKKPNKKSENTELDFPHQEHNENHLKVKRFRLHPTKNQKNVLNKWFGAYRWSYNEAKRINMRYHERRPKRRFKGGRKFLSLMSIRKKMRASRKWSTKDIPDRIMVGAIQDYSSNFKTCCSLVKNKKIPYFEIKDKRKKSLTQTLNLEKACFGVGNVLFPKYKLPEDTRDNRDKKFKQGLNLYGIYKSRTGKRKRVEKLKNTKIGHDCKLSYVNGKFFLLVPYEKEEVISTPEHQVISIDSGIRTFQTGYCPEGHTVEVCKNVNLKLKKIHDKIDILNRIFKEKGDRIIKTKRRRCFEKISDRINDLHWKTIRFLTDNYKNIVISDFKTKDILKKNYINRSVKRALNVLSHYKFRQRLLEKCEGRGNNLFVIDESFTSKTCGRCGRINQNLGASKTFVCPYCNYNADRDINAGRNMLLKFLSSATGG